MIAEPQIAGFFAALARTAAWGMSSPIIGDRTVPARVRIIGVASLALAMSSLHGEVRYASLPAILPLELLLGVIAGFAGRLVFAGIESGGQLIGMELGLGFAGTMDPTAG